MKPTVNIVWYIVKWEIHQWQWMMVDQSCLFAPYSMEICRSGPAWEASVAHSKEHFTDQWMEDVERGHYSINRYAERLRGTGFQNADDTLDHQRLIDTIWDTGENWVTGFLHSKICVQESDSGYSPPTETQSMTHNLFIRHRRWFRNSAWFMARTKLAAFLANQIHRLTEQGMLMESDVWNRTQWMSTEIISIHNQLTCPPHAPILQRKNSELGCTITGKVCILISNQRGWMILEGKEGQWASIEQIWLCLLTNSCIQWQSNYLH